MQEIAATVLNDCAAVSSNGVCASSENRSPARADSRAVLLVVDLRHHQAKKSLTSSPAVLIMREYPIWLGYHVIVAFRRQQAPRRRRLSPESGAADVTCILPVYPTNGTRRGRTRPIMLLVIGSVSESLD